MEQPASDSNEILASIQKVLDDTRKLHFRFFRYGVVTASRDARRKLKEIRPLIKAYLAASISESQRTDDHQ